MNAQFPAGGDELRKLAIEATRRALNDCGRATGEGDPLPVELVDVAARYNVPISTLVGYIQFCPRQQQITSEAFARHCRAALRQVSAVDDERYPTLADGDVCPQCGSHPVHRIGGFWVCASGRCAPRVVA
jgi:hypothetical protein